MDHKEFVESFKIQTGFYHETQRNLRCGQHTLNNLLQEKRFTDSDLNEIARNLDRMEDTVYVFKDERPNNMEETGFCNIQVLQEALKTCDIDLISLESQDKMAAVARANPEAVQAYICNVGEHWFAIRRFGSYYFDLNSMYTIPMIITPTPLTNYLEKYSYLQPSVFIVHGVIPKCEADRRFEIDPIHMLRCCSAAVITEHMHLLEEMQKRRKLFAEANGALMVPRALLTLYKKNPNSPDTQAMLKAYLPDDMLVDSISLGPDNSECSCANCKYRGMERAVARSRTNFMDKNQQFIRIQTVETAYTVNTPDSRFSATHVHINRCGTQQKKSSPQDFAVMEQQMLDRAIAESLSSTQMNVNDLIITKEQIQEPPNSRVSLNQVVTDATAAPSLLIERNVQNEIVIPNSNAHLSVAKTVTQAETPPNPVVTSSVETISDNVNAWHLTVQELRQQRRQKFGNRNVSIISPIAVTSDD